MNKLIETEFTWGGIKYAITKNRLGYCAYLCLPCLTLSYQEGIPGDELGLDLPVNGGVNYLGPLDQVGLDGLWIGWDYIETNYTLDQIREECMIASKSLIWC